MTCNTGAHKFQVTWKPKNFMFLSQVTDSWVTKLKAYMGSRIRD